LPERQPAAFSFFDHVGKLRAKLFIDPEECEAWRDRFLVPFCRNHVVAVAEHIAIDHHTELKRKTTEVEEVMIILISTQTV
jgi:hypothetical protein